MMNKFDEQFARLEARRQARIEAERKASAEKNGIIQTGVGSWQGITESGKNAYIERITDARLTSGEYFTARVKDEDGTIRTLCTRGKWDTCIRKLAQA